MHPVFIVLIVLAAIYLILVITDVVFYNYFKKIMIKHDKALTIILSNKLDTVKELYDYLKSKNVNLDDKIRVELENINVNDFSSQCDPLCKEATTKLSYSKDIIISAASEVKELKNDQGYLAYIDVLNQLDLVYRSNVVVYNIDVGGYNYWIKFLPTRYIYKIAKIKEKAAIS